MIAMTTAARMTAAVTQTPSNAPMMRRPVQTRAAGARGTNVAIGTAHDSIFVGMLAPSLASDKHAGCQADARMTAGR